MARLHVERLGKVGDILFVYTFAIDIQCRVKHVKTIEEVTDPSSSVLVVAACQYYVISS